MAKQQPYAIRGPRGGTHWIGGECPCRPYPAQAQGFAGVVHLEPDQQHFFEAQVCQAHERHVDFPGVIGVAVGPLCGQATEPQHVLSEAAAVALAIESFGKGRRGATVRVQVLAPPRPTDVFPSNLGGSDG